LSGGEDASIHRAAQPPANLRAVDIILLYTEV